MLDDAVKKYLPTKTITVRPNDKPFMNNTIRNKIRQRNRIHYKAKTNLPLKGVLFKSFE
jgi:translation initiation factor IF-1